MANAVNGAFTYLTVLTWSFEICGVNVVLTTPNPYLLSLCQSYFRFYPQAAPAVSLRSKPSIKVRLNFATSSTELKQLIPDKAEFIGQQEVTTIWKTVSRGREQFYFHFHFGNAVIRVEPASGRIVGIISQEALDWPHLMVNTYVFMTLMLALRGHSVYHLHTAAVLSPQQHLTLICGGQRAGKTTLATALGIGGWHPISDDGMVLRANAEGQAELHAFRRDFHLAAALLQQWEALHNVKVQYLYHDRACVDGLTLFNSVPFSEGSFTRVAQVLFPQLTGAKQSRLEPLPKSEALRRLIGQSMFFPLNRDHTQKQLNLLTALVKDTSFYQLWTGTDLWENPRLAADLLTSL